MALKTRIKILETNSGDVTYIPEWRCHKSIIIAICLIPFFGFGVLMLIGGYHWKHFVYNRTQQKVKYKLIGEAKLCIDQQHERERAIKQAQWNAEFKSENIITYP